MRAKIKLKKKTSSNNKFFFLKLILDDTFPCNFCAKIFASKPNLDSHVRKIHQNDKSSHICGTCLGTFSSAPNLKQHIKNVHEAEVCTI